MTDGANSLEIQLAIGRVAMGLLTAPYAGVKVAAYEPQRKTSVHDAWHGKKLSARHQQAWHLTMALFQDASGISVRNPGYGEAAGGGGQVEPRAHVNKAQQRLEWLLDRHLHTHERRLLHTLAMENFQKVKIHSLQQLGLMMDGYKDEAQARAAGVTSLHRLLDSLCEFHGI